MVRRFNRCMIGTRYRGRRKARLATHPCATIHHLRVAMGHQPDDTAWLLNRRFGPGRFAPPMPGPLIGSRSGSTIECGTP